MNVERTLIQQRKPQQLSRYDYNSEIIRVIDGDSLVLDVDLGLHQWARDLRFRLAGIDTPETRGASKEAGQAATRYVNEILEKEGNRVIIRTMKDRKGKYGRYMVVVWTAGTVTSLNSRLLASGHAVEYGTA